MKFQIVIYWNTIEFTGGQAHSSYGHYGLVMRPKPAIKCRINIHYEYTHLTWVRALKVI